MKRLASNAGCLITLMALVIGVSIWLDFGNQNWTYFQRSGSVVVLIGALLGYRSIVRLGKSGVGGAPVFLAKATLVSTDYSGPIPTAKVKYDDETMHRFVEDAKDKLAGYVGAILIVIGTFICGYGDFLGRVF